MGRRRCLACAPTLCEKRFKGQNSGRTAPREAKGTHDMTDLSGRVFVITGGNGGIGLGMAEGIAAAGGSVAIWGRNPKKNRQALDRINEFGVPAIALECDVGDPRRGRQRGIRHRQDRSQRIGAGACRGAGTLPDSGEFAFAGLDPNGPRQGRLREREIQNGDYPAHTCSPLGGTERIQGSGRLSRRPGDQLPHRPGGLCRRGLYSVLDSMFELARNFKHAV